MTTEMVVQAFGPAAAVVIIALSTVVVYLFRVRENERKDSIRQYNELQEKRYAEGLETQKRIEGLVTEQKELPERIATLVISLLNQKGKRG